MELDSEREKTRRELEGNRKKLQVNFNIITTFLFLWGFFLISRKKIPELINLKASLSSEFCPESEVHSIVSR